MSFGGLLKRNKCENPHISDLKKELRTSLYRSDLSFSVDQYLAYSVTGSLLLGISLMLAVVQIENFDYPSMAILSAILSLAFFLILKRIPGSLAKARGMQIESDLPIAIRSIGIQINMKVPFESALQNVANSNYRCSYEFQKVIKMMDGGASIPDSLRQMAERVDSQIVKKLIVQLMHVYLEGLDGSELKHSADELIHSQRFRFKEFSAKLSFMGLMFIALSAIAPTMYLAYVVVAGLYLESPTSPSDIWLVFLVVFPLAEILLILYIKYSTPPVLTNASEQLFSKRELIMLNEELRNTGINIKFKEFISAVAAVSIFAAVATIFFFTIYGFAFLFIPVAIYFILLWLIERRSNEIEQYLPDALLYAATLEFGIPMEKIIENIGNSGYHSLSREFKKAERQIKAGINPTHALLNMRDRNNSILLDRVVSLLIQCYKTGKEVHQAIKETAEDIFELNMLTKEQASSLSLQKYTVLVGGCVFVPMILSVILNIISGIQPPGQDAQSMLFKETILSASFEAVQAYLAVYVLLSSLFVAFQEGRLRTFIGYFLLFLPITLFIFNFAKDLIKIV